VSRTVGKPVTSRERADVQERLHGALQRILQEELSPLDLPAPLRQDLLVRILRRTVGVFNNPVEAQQNAPKKRD
jgi:hypothetical protein